MCFFFAHAGNNLDTLQAQIFQALTCNLGVRIKAGHNNLADARTCQGYAAGTGTSVMGAGLQCYIGRCTLSHLLSLRQGIDLGMRFAGLMVIALTHNIAFGIHNHTANHRVGTGVALCLQRQLQGPLHICFICHSCQNITFQ